MDYTPAPNIETTLPGLTLTEVNDDLSAFSAGGRSFTLDHNQDCCESVGVHDVKGNVSDLLNTPLLSVKEDILDGWPEDVVEPSYTESYTWTVFTFTTAKGSVTVRWLGTSNGYYSESVSFAETTR